MILEKQVCSLELAKKFKKLGVRQESIWHWKEFKNHRMSLRHSKGFLSSVSTKSNYFSAFTVAELGEILPDNLVSSGMDEGKWYCVYGPRENGDDMPDCKWEDKSKYEFSYMTIGDKTEANARAKMLIYLIENKLIKINQ